MLKYWFLISLIALITLQSVIAMADGHQVHQSGASRFDVSLDQQDDSDYENSRLEKFDRLSPSDPHDCDHYCHCHGVACAAVVSNYVHNILAAPMLAVVGYELFFPTDPPFSPFRPPIA